ncbi:hypothetical protein ACT4Y0_19815 [Acinetobacter baumannii]
MEIKANKKSVCELKDFYFSVPNYQREYVWKADDEPYRVCRRLFYLS